jgi:manganese/zinc/iron transport system permease protein
VLVVSLLFAPRRGLLWARLREALATGRIRRENLLKDLYRVGEEINNWDLPVASPILMGVRGRSAHEMELTVRDLVRRSLVERDGDSLRLTDPGKTEASEVVRRHRLWELYLIRRMELADDHVHRDAEAMEHVLSPDAVRDIDERLGYPRIDPHGKPIPRPADMAEAER